MPNGEPENFFALVEGDDRPEVRRLVLHRSAQETLADIFDTAHGEFIDGPVREIEYDGVYKADSDEIVVAEPFDLPEEVIPALREPTRFPPLDLRADVVPRVKAIFTGEVRNAETVVLFQAFQRNQYLHNRRFSLSFAQEMFRPLEDPGFAVRGELHAVYENDGTGENGRLLFRKDWWVKRMLDLSDHYREATDAELDEFMAIDTVRVDDREQFHDNADTWVRKRVAMINDREVLEDHAPSEIRMRGQELGVEINVRPRDDGGEEIVFPDSKSELKTTLRFLNEDMFAGPITEDRFVSTNKRRMQDD